MTRFLLLLFMALVSSPLLANIVLSDSEQEWLKQGHKVRVAVFDNHYPYIFRNDSGEYEGIVKDYLQYIEKVSGIDFVEVPATSLIQGYDGLSNGEFDVYPMTFDFEGSTLDVSYTVPYLPYHYFIFINNLQPVDLTEEGEDQKHRTLAVIRNSAIERYLANKELPVRIEYYDSDRQALKALDEGEVAAFVGEKVSALRLVQGLNLKNVVPVRPTKELYGLRLQMALNPRSSLLHSIINKSLSTMPYDIQNGIMEHWFDNEPFKNQLNGFMFFNRIPYTYNSDSGVGLEYSIIQHLFESMGYDLGRIVPAEKSANFKDLMHIDGVDFAATQTPSVTRSRYDIEHEFFYSRPYLTQEYRLISRVGDSIVVKENGTQLEPDKRIGAVVGSSDPVVKDALQMFRKRFGRSIDQEYLELESAIEAIVASKIDYLLVDYREYNAFLNRAESKPALDPTQEFVTRFSVPLTLAFRDEVLRDKFNAELDIFIRSSEYRRLEKLYETTSFQAKATGGILMTEIVSYLVQVNKLELLDSIVNAFNFSDGFAALSLKIGGGSGRLLNYKDINGRLTPVDSFSRQGLVYLKRDLMQGQGIEAVPLGEMTIYSELGRNSSFSDNYVPPLSVFEFLSESDFDSIRNIYDAMELNTSTINFTAAELDWIENNPVVKVGIDPAALPYEGVQAGEYRGIIADILQEMSSAVGLTFEPVLVDSWQATVDMLEARELPMVSAAVENRSLNYDFVPNPPLFTDQLAVVGHIKQDYGRGLNSMSSMRVGLQRGASNTPTLMESYPDIEWVEVANSEVGLSLLDKGELDGYIDTTYVINYILNENAYRDLIIVDRLSNTVSPTFHTLKSESTLGSIVSKGIRAISATKKQQIINNWATNRVIEKVDHTILFLVVGFSLLVLAIFFESNRRLKRQMAATSRAELEARQSRNQLFDILNTSSIAALIVQDGRVQYSNKRAHELFGVSSENGDGYLIEKLYADTGERELIYTKLARHGKVVDREVDFQREDGAKFTALSSYYEIEYKERPATLFWSLDISEIKKLNRELADATLEANIANQTKSAFLANMSHEIRTPMNAIIGMSHLALEESLGTKAKNYVSKVHQSAQSLLLIINDILDISKIEAGKFELEQRPFSLRETLRHIADVIGFKIFEKELEFVFKVDGSIPRMVVGDELRLSQVLINLGNNAAKFTHEGHVIVGIEGRANPDDDSRFIYHFYVEDTGIGIAPDKLDSLFDSFHQADVSTTREYGGTGLGLSICKQIVELMGGHIWVESQPDKGSIFHFEVELEVSESNLSLFSSLQPAINILSKKQVNLLAPDRFTREAVNMALTNTPIVPHTFNSYKLLLDELIAGHPDSVTYVSDAALDSQDIAMQLVQLNQYTKVVLCTSKDNLADVAQSLRVNVLRRPWLPFELITTLSGRQEQEINPSNQAQKNANQLLDGQSILLVEDNELNQELVLGLLEPYDLNIDIVENGLMAVEKARHGSYSLILMDIQMPVLGGYEATRRIRDFDAHTPIVAMTANAMVGDQRKAQQVGMNDFVPKPIDVQRLISVMTRLSHNSSAKVELVEERVHPQETSVVFDSSLGLTTCGQDEYLLLKLLRKFSNNSKQRVDNLIKANQSSDSETAIREVHTLKSTAASIGAMQLAGICASYEQQLDQVGGHLDALQVERLKQSLTQVLHAIQIYIEDEPSIEAPSSTEEIELDQSFIDELEKLKLLLQNYDIQSIELIQSLKLRTDNATALSRLAELEDILSYYQFEQALDLLNQWTE